MRNRRKTRQKIRCELHMLGVFGRIEGVENEHSWSLNETLPEIDEWKHKWETPIITYRLNNYTGDWKKQKDQTTAVTVAFRAWQLRVKDIRFKRIYAKNVPVDINISFKPLENFRTEGVLAHAYYPGQGDVSGDIEINDHWNWVPHANWQNLARPPLLAILMHEIGHSLGLKHDTRTQESIMYPSFNLGRSKNALHENDIKRIQAKYGKRNLIQQITDYFRGRRARGEDFYETR